MKLARIALLLVVLAIAAFVAWQRFAPHELPVAEHLTVYYTKIDGTTLGEWTVSLRPSQAGESADEHRHNTALYAAVQAVAGPPSDIDAIRFPSGTHVLGVSVSGSTATVDLSKDVTNGVGGSFGESGEFKGLVYTVTSLPGIEAVAMTVEGHRLETLPGGHLDLGQPLRRTDW